MLEKMCAETLTGVCTYILHYLMKCLVTNTKCHSWCFIHGSGWMVKCRAFENLRKMWYMYTMEYYSVSKRNEFELVEIKWINLESVIQGKVSKKEKQILYINAYIWILEKWYR